MAGTDPTEAAGTPTAADFTAGDLTAVAIPTAVVFIAARLGAVDTLTAAADITAFRADSMPHGKETAAHPIKGSDRFRPGNPQILDMAAAVAGRMPIGLPLDGQIRELGLGAVRAGETRRGLPLRSERTGRQILSKA